MDTPPAPDTRVVLASADSDADYWDGKAGTVRATGYVPPRGLAASPLGEAAIGTDPASPEIVWVEVDGEHDEDHGPYSGIFAFRISELAPIEDDDRCELCGHPEHTGECGVTIGRALTVDHACGCIGPLDLVEDPRA